MRILNFEPAQAVVFARRVANVLQFIVEDRGQDVQLS